METENNMSNEPTAPQNWRGRGGTPLPLPSGNTALVRSPGIQHFLKTGQIPNSLRKLIMEAIGDGKTNPDQKLSTLFEDPSNMTELFELFDRVLLQVVIEPKVKAVPLKEGQEIPLEERDQSVIYVDEVDLQDKVYIFGYAVGGTKDLESFRKEQEAVVGNLSAE